MSQPVDELYRITFDAMDDPISIVDPALRFILFNDAFKRLAGGLGLSTDVIGKTVFEIFPFLPQRVADEYHRAFETGETLYTEERNVVDGREYVTATRKIPVKRGDQVVQVITVLHDITDRQYHEAMLWAALEQAERRGEETRALLTGANAILEHREFKDSARAIFNAARDLIGAQSGYVAMLTVDGQENEVLFLDAGGLACTVDPNLPMPIRGLRETAYRTGQVVYENDFAGSDWVVFLPSGHVRLDNVMFAPLIVDGEKAGLLGLANKPGGFTHQDARMAAAFSELAAIALRNSRTLEALETSEERFRSVVQTAGEAIVTIDSRQTISFWNRAAETIFGYTADEITGQPFSTIIPLYPLRIHGTTLHQPLSGNAANGNGITGLTLEVTGRRKDGSEFPAEMAITSWQMHEGRFVTGIIRDITERKAAQQAALDLAMERERVRLLQEFIGNATHDLKTPLTTMKISLAVLQHVGADDDGERRERHVGILHAQTAHLEKLLEDMLSLARLDRESELRLYPVDLNTCVQQALDHLPSRYDRQRLAVTFTPYVEPVIVPGDSLELRRALAAVLTNALNYTPDGGTIDVCVSRQETKAVITVADTGVGIAPDVLPHIFERFYRGDTARTTDRGGMGLGLAIARKVIEGHGGTITAASQVGEGSTFTIRLPLEVG